MSLSITLVSNYNIRNIFDSYAYSFRFINLEKYLPVILINDSKHSLKFTVLVVVAYTNKKKKKKQYTQYNNTTAYVN